MHTCCPLYIMMYVYEIKTLVAFVNNVYMCNSMLKTDG